MATPKTPETAPPAGAVPAKPRPEAPAAAKPEVAAKPEPAAVAEPEVAAKPEAAAAVEPAVVLAQTVEETAAAVQDAARDAVETAAAKAEEVTEQIRQQADETLSLVETDYATASRSISALGRKTLDSVRANTNAAFDHAVALLEVKTLSEAIELNRSFVRRQSEALAAQTREFGELAQKVAAEAAAPVRARFEKAFKTAA